MDDRELNRLLRAWVAPNAPTHLAAPRARAAASHWLISGTIRLPVPAAAAATLLAAVWLAYTWVQTTPAPRTASARTAASARPSGELARYPLTGRLQGFDAVVVELNFSPGVSSPEHRHPGAILGYVVDGQMRFAINHEPDRIVAAGDTFFEPSGALHTAFGSANPDAPARAVAFLVVPSGSPPAGAP
ncbi:MAG: cupin domain-containing protein [Vicinamibacterales bacterium]